MNLAMEYVLRSGEALAALQYPFTILTTRASGGSRTVVGVERDRRRLRVTHWLLGECRSDCRLPPSEVHEIAEADLLSSPATVLPGHLMLPYQCQPYRHRHPRRLDSVTPKDIEDYRLMYTTFLNSPAHVAAREEWVWDSFVDLYGDRHRMGPAWDWPEADRAKRLRAACRSAYPTWRLWERHLLAAGPRRIAAEVLFEEPYRRMGEQMGIVKREREPHMWLPRDVYQMLRWPI